MKKLFSKSILVLFIVLTTAAVFSISAWASGGKKYELNFSSEYPPKHPTSVIFIPLLQGAGYQRYASKGSSWCSEHPLR